MNDTEKQIGEIFETAKNEAPFGLPRDYGFDTRLRESIHHSEPVALEFFNALCWRFSLVCLPVAIPALIALAMLDISLSPSGIGSALVIYTEFISLDSLSLF